MLVGGGKWKCILDSTHLRGFTQKYGSKYGYGNNSSAAVSHHRSHRAYPSKGFTNIQDKEQLGSTEQFDDLDGPASQRGLVYANQPETFPLGTIQKKVETTITQVDQLRIPRGRRQTWEE